MTINHHPDIATLMAFSAGSLDEPYATVVATHLAMSEGGRHTLRGINAIGGALLENEAEATMSSGSLDRLMGALGEPDPYCPIVRGAERRLAIRQAAAREMPKLESACTTIVVARN